MSDIFVRYLDMDVNVSEHVIQNPDGSYTIFINSRLTWERQQEAYKHALGHIKNFDFEKQILRELSTMPTTVGQEMLLE